MSTRETDPSAGADTADGETALDRFDAFPWAVGVLTGACSFVGGYLSLVVYVVVGPANLPGSLVEQLARVGFLFYNAHGILVIPETGPNTPAALPVNLLPQAAIPLLYQTVPVLALVLGSAALTRWRGLEETDGIEAIAVGLSMTLGYLAVALVGTYVFTLTQSGVPFHPDRPPTFLFATVYPLVAGTLGSVVTQTVLVGSARNVENADG